MGSWTSSSSSAAVSCLSPDRWKMTGLAFSSWDPPDIFHYVRQSALNIQLPMYAGGVVLLYYVDLLTEHFRVWRIAAADKKPARKIKVTNAEWFCPKTISKPTIISLTNTINNFVIIIAWTKPIKTNFAMSYHNCNSTEYQLNTITKLTMLLLSV